MVNVMIHMIAFFITIPFLATWIFYFVSLKIYRHRWKAIHSAINYTTILYIIAVLFMLALIFENSFFGIIIGCILCLLVTIIIYQWKMKSEIMFFRAVKVLWRICFLFFTFMYICLVFIGVANRIFFY